MWRCFLVVFSPYIIISMGFGLIFLGTCAATYGIFIMWTLSSECKSGDGGDCTTGSRVAGGSLFWALIGLPISVILALILNMILG